MKLKLFQVRNEGGAAGSPVISYYSYSKTFEGDVPASSLEGAFTLMNGKMKISDIVEVESSEPSLNGVFYCGPAEFVRLPIQRLHLLNLRFYSPGMPDMYYSETYDSADGMKHLISDDYFSSKAALISAMRKKQKKLGYPYIIKDIPANEPVVWGEFALSDIDDIRTYPF